MTVVKLTQRGMSRVLNGCPGMTFIVDRTSPSQGGGLVYHVRDYRFTDTHAGYQIWSLPQDCCEVVQ